MANMSDGQVRVRVSVRARVKSRTTISGLDLGLGLRRGCPSGGDRVHARAQPRTKDKEGGVVVMQGPSPGPREWTKRRLASSVHSKLNLLKDHESVDRCYGYG